MIILNVMYYPIEYHTYLVTKICTHNNIENYLLSI